MIRDVLDWDLARYRSYSVDSPSLEQYMYRYCLDSMSTFRVRGATTFRDVANHTWLGRYRCKRYTGKCEPTESWLAELRCAVSWVLVVDDDDRLVMRRSIVSTWPTERMQM